MRYNELPYLVSYVHNPLRPGVSQNRSFQALGSKVHIHVRGSCGLKWNPIVRCLNNALPSPLVKGQRQH